MSSGEESCPGDRGESFFQGRCRVVDLSAGLWPELLQKWIDRLPPGEALFNALGPGLLQEVLEPTHSFHVGILAPEGKGLVGILGGYCVVDEVEIHRFYLHPDFRNKGLGTALLRKLVAVCSRVGIVAIHLEVRSRSPARELYLREGFRQTGIRKGYYGPEWSQENRPDDAIMMMYTARVAEKSVPGVRELLDRLAGDLFFRG